MKDTERVIVDFILPEPEAPARGKPGERRLGKCAACGGEKYSLASELGGNAAKGVPASRMFECLACGTYRLG